MILSIYYTEDVIYWLGLTLLYLQFPENSSIIKYLLFTAEIRTEQLCYYLQPPQWMFIHVWYGAHIYMAVNQ